MVYKYVGSDNLVFFLSHCTEIEHNLLDNNKTKEECEKERKEEERQKSQINSYGKITMQVSKIYYLKHSRFTYLTRLQQNIYKSFMFHNEIFINCF